MHRDTALALLLAASSMALAGGVAAQDAESEEQFRARCEEAGYADIVECRKFIAADTIVDDIGVPADPIPVVEAPSDIPLVDAPSGVMVTDEPPAVAPPVPVVDSPTGIPVASPPGAVGSPTGVPVVPAPRPPFR
jgi:hypothetical protein